MKQVATQFKRYLFSEIDRSERLVIITGYRGVGKTTWEVQYLTVDDVYTFKVGGPDKGPEQIKGVPNAYLAVDIEGGSNRRIPLWLFGMLY